MQQLITISDIAANKVKSLLASRGKPSLGIRVGVSAKGCNGLSYVMEFADKQEQYEELIQDKGVTLIVDPMATMYILGTELDYKETMMESGFVFNNPNKKSSCGCGSSFSV